MKSKTLEDRVKQLERQVAILQRQVNELKFRASRDRQKRYFYGSFRAIR